MKANELKRGLVFQADGRNIVVKQIHVQTASSRSGNTLYKVRGQDVVTRQKFEQSFKGDDNIIPVEISRKAVQPLYREADGWTFMDSETYEQYILSDDVLEDELPFIIEGMEGINTLISEDAILGIELPPTVALEIMECAPAMKAASSSARTKPATMNTGLVVQVPEYLTPGETIKINPDTKEFLSRV
ncbi:MAG: elongation factor P-like protein YeiP [Gammaproteobacteria bacterium]|nr:elongation factor P-like protein YeiP [Gammaproteobacteria bacterium]